MNKRSISHTVDFPDLTSRPRVAQSTADSPGDANHCLTAASACAAGTAPLHAASRQARLRKHLLAVFATAAAVLTGAAHATQVNTRVTGLPSGLNVGFLVQFAHCNAGAAPFFADNTAITLTESQEYFSETVSILGGPPRIVLLARTVYSGAMTVQAPASNGCSALIPNNTSARSYLITGQLANGTTRLRQTSLLIKQLTTSSVGFIDDLRAETTGLNGNGNFPVDIAIGSRTDISVANADAFGSSAIGAQTLELQKQVNTFGYLHFATAVRFAVNAGNVCVTSAGQSGCRALSAGGTLTVGDVALRVTTLRDSIVNHGLLWSFTLASSFATSGIYQLAASADDVDPFAYVVNGAPGTLDLLPWQSLRAAVNFVP